MASWITYALVLSLAVLGARGQLIGGTTGLCQDTTGYACPDGNSARDCHDTDIATNCGSTCNLCIFGTEEWYVALYESYACDMFVCVCVCARACIFKVHQHR